MSTQIVVELCSVWGGDREAANAAWASSFSKEVAEAKSDSDVARVVSNIVNLGHDTPKERIWLEFFITCPIFVERQFDKYRMTVQFQDFDISYQVGEFGRQGITQNELSGRYRTLPGRFMGLPKDAAEIFAKANPDDSTIMNEIEWSWFLKLQRQHQQYQEDLQQLREAEFAGRITNREYKRAREVLRGTLGTAFFTDMRLVLNMNAFEHIMNQRLADDAQVEAQEVARKMLQCVQQHSLGSSTLFQTMVQKNGWLK